MQNRKIKDRDTILQEMRDYLQKRSAKVDQDYLVRKAHFDKLAGLLQDKDYENLTAHIEQGLRQFTQVVFTSTYYSFLQELKLNLVPENKEDELNRIQRLAAVIFSNDETRIRLALQEGCLTVMNTPYKRDPNQAGDVEEGTLPLELAMKNDAMKAFNILHAEGASKNYKGYKLLHFLAKHGKWKEMGILGLLEASKDDLNKIDDQGRTALNLACQYNQNKSIEQLLTVGADPNIKPVDSKSCLYWAVANKNLNLILQLLQKGEGIDELSYKAAKTASIQNSNQETNLIYNLLKEGKKYHSNKLDWLFIKFSDNNEQIRKFCLDAVKTMSDAEKDNALFIACATNQTLTAKSLLQMGGNPKKCLDWSIDSGNLELVSHLVKDLNLAIDISSYKLAKRKSSSVNSGDNEKQIFQMLYNKAKLPVKQHKQKIIAARNHAFFKPEPERHSFISIKDNPIPAIGSRIYSQDKRIEDAVIKQVSEMYKAPLLQPLLTIVGLGSAGMRRHRQTESLSKPLRTIIDIQSKHVGRLIIDANVAAGAYTHSNSVYISRNDILGTMLHEWKHFVDQEVFGSVVMKLSSADQAKFNIAREQVFEAISRFPSEDQSSKHIKDSFANVFNGSYEKVSIDYELLARVPEVLGTLGMEKGVKWLETYTPSLFDFYKNTYNNYLNEHIEKMRQEFSQQVVELPSRLGL